MLVEVLVGAFIMVIIGTMVTATLLYSERVQQKGIEQEKVAYALRGLVQERVEAIFDATADPDATFPVNVADYIGAPVEFEEELIVQSVEHPILIHYSLELSELVLDGTLVGHEVTVNYWYRKENLDDTTRSGGTVGRTDGRYTFVHYGI